MRAVFYNNLDPSKFNKKKDEVFSIEGPPVHHLKNVVRIKSGEEILLINGKGLKVLAKVKEIQKNEILLEIVSSDYFVRNNFLSLAICMPKKEAFEEIIKSCVEIGISRIYPLVSTFSQIKKINFERINRIIESALIQSNNPHHPEIFEIENLQNFFSKENKFDKIIYFCASDKEENNVEALKIKKEDKVLIIVGPEGGLSDSEEKFLLSQKDIRFVNLSTYILRSPTAVEVASGYILGLIAG